ncbi:Surface presentation of antigens protein SpaK [Sodalis glossinidius str. 'morsitans']|uniref:Surface presentation of antigens protein SpaK n=1 Tax=Sodalis glossinidius (strain morsitans) TaxID=343509 RepID=Q2NR61_SODGM|nr:SPI-1 type III secretion system chaperone SpaK [Sodalis glossinidius]BAE75364.1 type III secretion apparatus InvB [Sodalis glossinidius str. 'morsitans']CRL46389.1 Surface presentation of antigens protein SpaK [Sodalis glossinidius str. 'morsitans']
MYVDIAALVREALLDSGCDPSLLGSFDSHSTIALDFNDMPSIYISSSDDDIWLWSRIADYQETLIEQCSYKLLKDLLEGAEYIRGGHFSLAENEGYLELKALLQPWCLENKQNFASALSGFFERLERFTKVLR